MVKDKNREEEDLLIFMEVLIAGILGLIVNIRYGYGAGLLTMLVTVIMFMTIMMYKRQAEFYALLVKHGFKTTKAGRKVKKTRR